MTAEQKVRGPAAYFPAIETTYGRPVDHWLAVLRAAGDLKHLELVTLLKTAHKLGHGHANALVAHHLKSVQVNTPMAGLQHPGLHCPTRHATGPMAAA